MWQAFRDARTSVDRYHGPTVALYRRDPDVPDLPVKLTGRHRMSSHWYLPQTSYVGDETTVYLNNGFHVDHTDDLWVADAWTTKTGHIQIATATAEPRIITAVLSLVGLLP
jgi:hypothetical protein